MKLTLVTDGQLPGAFLIEADNPSDALILRSFCADKRKICIANFGGNSGEWRFSMLVQHQEDGSERLGKIIRESIFNKKQENEFGLSVCDCSPVEMQPYLEEFRSGNGTLILYRCGFCSRFIPNARVKEVARLAGEEIKAGWAVYLAEDGKYYGYKGER